MDITEVRVKLVQRNAERLRAFCSVTLDGEFVVRDLKIIEGVNGMFVAMPSRKLTDRCPKCGAKNHLRARFCNECGTKLGDNRASRDTAGRTKLHADVAHPINAACRERIQQAIVAAFEEEVERSQDPDYVPIDLDEEDYDMDDDVDATNRSRGKSNDRSRSDYEELVADLKREREETYYRDQDEPEDNDENEDDATDEEPEEEDDDEQGEQDEDAKDKEEEDGFSAGIF